MRPGDFTLTQFRFALPFHVRRYDMPITLRPIEVYAEKYLRNCIRAYFEGTQNLRWIMGVIGDGKEQARVIMQSRFGQYAGSQAYRDLMAQL
jgi:hypothetical protein